MKPMDPTAWEAEYTRVYQPLIDALAHDGLESNVGHMGGGCLALHVWPAGGTQGGAYCLVTDGEDGSSLTSPPGPTYLVGVYHDGNGWGGEIQIDDDFAPNVDVEHIGAACRRLLADRAGVVFPPDLSAAERIAEHTGRDEYPL